MDDATTTPHDVLTAALGYAEIGLRPIPLEPRGKRPWPGLRRWQVKASSEPAAVQRLFAGRPGANLGLATGRGVFVLDTDKGAGGFESAERFANGRGLPKTATAATGGGGRHQMFRGPAGLVIRNAAGLLPGLDVRGDGGQIAVSPSVHPSGNRYTWDRHPSEGIAEAPTWLIDELTRRAPDREGRCPPRGTPDPDRGPKVDPPPLDRDGDTGELMAEAVERFPVGGHGQRNGQMVRLIGSLLRRRFRPPVIGRVVELWWVHFHAMKVIRTHPNAARPLIQSCFDSVLNSEDFQWYASADEHLALALAVRLDDGGWSPPGVKLVRLGTPGEPDREAITDGSGRGGERGKSIVRQ